MSKLVVVSTGYRSPNRDRCIGSVRDQTVECLHIYTEASEQEHPKVALENRYDIYHRLKPDDIVVELDGDDWLATPHALETVRELYKNPDTWLTYGSFVHADGRPGFCAPYNPGENYRTSQWRASHLKTFRANLFMRIMRADLTGPLGTGFCEHARDLITMLPMLEMAGPEHVVFCPDTLYVYSLATSFEWNTDAKGLDYEQACVTWARSRPPYKRLAGL